MLERFSTTIVTVTSGVTAAASDEILFGSYAGGIVFLPAGVGVTTITWYVAEKPGGTYLLAYDEDGTAVTQTVSHTKAYAIPAALYGARAIKAVASAGTASTIIVSLKA
jgi:hypothetical protein